VEIPIGVRDLTGKMRYVRFRNFTPEMDNQVGFLESHKLQQQYRCRSIDSQHIWLEWKDAGDVPTVIEDEAVEDTG